MVLVIWTGGVRDIKRNSATMKVSKLYASQNRMRIIILLCNK